MSNEDFKIVGVLLDDLPLLPAGVQAVIAQWQGTEMADELHPYPRHCVVGADVRTQQRHAVDPEAHTHIPDRLHTQCFHGRQVQRPEIAGGLDQHLCDPIYAEIGFEVNDR